MKIIKILLSVIPALIFVFAIYVIINIAVAYRKQEVPHIFGYSYMIVVTGSMEPTIAINDFIVVKARDTYVEDDIITFYYDIKQNGTLEVVTHRIVAINDDEIVAKGDAVSDPNQTQTITKDDIIGKVIYQSTFLGQFLSLNFLQNKNLIFGILVFSLSVFAIYQIVKIIKLRKENQS